MTRIADAHGAINLSQGFPDFDPPEEITHALAHTAANGPHQYAVTWGSPEFRAALSAKHERFTGIQTDPDTNIVVTCGSTEAMMASMLTVCNPGDKVVIFSPFYENYIADAILSGAVPVHVELHPPHFDFDRNDLRKAFESRPKALILCNPSNPSGKVFTHDELLYIASLADEFDTFIITDEVYEHIVYDPNRHVHFASLPGMFERTITCGSLSKTYSITGWRLGHIIAPEEVIKRAKKVHDFLTVGAAAPLQKAAIAGLELPSTYYESLKLKYAGNKDLFLGYLKKAGLKFTDPQGAYYVLVDISEFGVESDTCFCEWLAREVGVAAVPGSSFFRGNENRFIRFHFAKKEETLIAAGEKLLNLRRTLRESVK